LCALGEFATMAVVTGIERFPQDFQNVVHPLPPSPPESELIGHSVREGSREEKYVKADNAHN
jgi:hypothetical protein